MFDHFALDRICLPGASLRVRHGGSGAPVVLLHGHPRTHTTWHAVAPLLAEHFTVVCPDLRGYGQSSKPDDDGSHAAYSKRAMADDIAELMSALGHDRFSIVGHDRGGYVALRAALDHPERVDKLVFMGVVPIGEAIRHCDARFATEWWHWFFFNQPDVPERVITADPDAWYLRGRTDMQTRMGAENYQDFLAAIRDPATVHAMLEDYRAGLSIDRQHDEHDMRLGNKVASPTLVVIASKEGDDALYPDLSAIWSGWADEVRIASIDTGHHIAEEDPSGLAAILQSFLTAR
jgi:haloacetate dehalogenase